MASTSASSVQKSFKYDVFLSFRGEDTQCFVDHLYHALVNKGIFTCKEYETLEKRRKISDDVIRSIEDSRIHTIVFSKNYASSSWCLDELVKIMECHKTKEQTAYPIFYDVEPTEVRHQSGTVKDAFAKHEKEEAAGIWRNAMKEAADLAGRELKTTFDGPEAKFIQKVVEDISLELRFIDSSVDDKLIGMETRVKDVLSSLEDGSDDVHMIGIKGIGGGGKTTLARAIFYHISSLFEGKSFVENVREVSKVSGLKELQKQVLKDVLNDQSIDVTSVYQGRVMMKKIMSSRKVLVVLDDVDGIQQLEALAGEPTWFKPGSTIIITTRDEEVLVAHRVRSIHDVNLLSHEEGIRLFSRYAFGKEIPIEGYKELSRKVLHYASGLPLTIKVLGSSLCGKTECEWNDAIERLKEIPEKQTLKRLELSYSGLEHDHKEVFLEVACILKGMSTAKAIRVLESCGFHARFALKVLEQKSLITISDTDALGLHDHLAEVGRNIVRRLHPREPYRHNQLWIREEIEDILVNDLGTEATRSIKLLNTNLSPDTIMNGLTKMKRLRFLYMDNGYKTNVYASPSGYKCASLPNALRYLYWPSYPLSCLPETFRANNLVSLEMPHSNISQLWEGRERKVLNKLRFLDLSFSRLITFDVELTPQIERLDFRGCNDFVEFDMPVVCPKLKYLNLSGSKLSYLNLGLTPNIKSLDLRECDDFVELYMPIECQKLKFLNLSGSKVSNLNLGLTPNLERLDLKECCLQEIHAPVGCLKNLVYLNLSGCLRFEYFLVDKQYESPDPVYVVTLELTAESVDICPLHPNNNWPKFQFKCNYDEPLPSLSGNLEKLLSFGLCACTNFESFSASICGLQHLRILTLEGNIPEVPKDLWQLESLEQLTLSLKEIKHLPDSIWLLKHLKSLALKSCILLEQLPKDLGRLECLEELRLLDCISLRDIPNSICAMQCLKYLHLPYCVLVDKLPDELGRLRSLKELDIQDTSINHLPQSIFELKGLRIVWSRVHLESYGFISFEKLSEHTASCNIGESQHESPGLGSVITLVLTAESVDICSMHPNNNLPKFLFKCKYAELLPSSRGNLEKPISFGLCACTNFESFFESICGFQHLRKLTLEGSIPMVPKDLYQLESLQSLTLSLKEIKHLPYSICLLKHLKSLELKSCFLLDELPKDLGNLECLEKLHLSDCISLRDIPNSICTMKCLKYLHIPYCGLVKKLPDELGDLKSLKELNIEGTGIDHLPYSIFQLKDLCIVWSRGRLESYDFTSLKALSRYTASCHIKNRKALTTGVSLKG